MKKLLHKCVVCRKIDGKAYASSLPPPLPEFRVTQSSPFAFTGLDYAGPLYLKGTENKVWICLFTCCATRALLGPGCGYDHRSIHSMLQAVCGQEGNSSNDYL